MNKTMKAIIWDGDSLPVCRDAQIPEPAAGEVLLQILRAGICGSDLSILSGKHPRAKAPLILGHELAARVVRLGSDVVENPGLGLKKDALVTVEPIVSCGECVACRNGFPHVCSSLKLYGIDLPGGMAEYVCISADRIIPARESMDPDMVVMAEPLAVAVHAVRSSGVCYGDTVVVLGGGPIGLLIALVVRQTTSTEVIVSEPQPSRRKIAEKLGLFTFDPTTGSIEDLVAERTGGKGADLCFESAGSQAAILSSTKILRPRGTLIQVAMPKDQRIFNIVDLTFKELVVRGIRVYEPNDFDIALDYLVKQPELFRPFLSRHYHLDEVSEAFNAAIAGDMGLRIIFHIAD